ncbi:SSI family serine proteinase inhibitor [Saccharomonospora xinjiangensis]|uniref:SSI family serine proteinase inhibitor n=1 Tax=Saccharomonospora xinjiangensis TaxID=75294 RepID=UPI00107045F6|nr:SSI family serine proteinase inhibitor [Saccharomonospora xinjiangensis]
MSMFGATSLAACAVMAVCTTGPAGPVTPDSSFVLTLTDARGGTTSVQLTCGPTQGNHPQGEAACRSLERADGDFTRLPVKNQACTMIYSPVLATASGNWHGTPVEFDTEYSNRCVADTHSGGVFSF